MFSMLMQNVKTIMFGGGILVYVREKINLSNAMGRI